MRSVSDDASRPPQSKSPIDILLTIPGSPRMGLGPDFIVHDLPAAGDPPALVAAVGDRVRGVLASASQPTKIDAAFLDRLPALEIISVFGVGLDRIDLAAAAERGVTVTSTPDVPTEEVADLALGLLIATVRRIPQADRFVRAGLWTQGPIGLSASLRDRSVGVVGLGRIGRAFAKRCAACDVKLAYTSRQRQDAPYDYYPSVLDLARAVDTLVIAAAGGPETVHLVNAEVLAALGSAGILINVARGSIVDESALIQSLTQGRLLAAGLDVFEAEPQVSPILLGLDNVVLLPHVGSATSYTRRAMAERSIGNLRSWFADPNHVLAGEGTEARWPPRA